jgi:zinc protease
MLFHMRASNWIIIVSLLIALLAFLAFSGCSGLKSLESDTTANIVQKPSWPHEISDLIPDPSLQFGRFDNGFRYVFKENNTPSDRVSMHLYVQVGSLLESEPQRGIAHFLEHMQFNGSTRFAPDEMVKYFQRIGMQFGPDANAHTGLQETVYDILLPNGDAQSLTEAMLVLHEYAQGALLLAPQIEQEKKVVLAEKRSRDSADYRMAKATFAFEMPGTLPPKRFPIGEDETIRQFDQTMLRWFYDTWYRPENMVLVIVGRFDPDIARRLAENQFADLRPRSKEADRPDFGHFHHQGLKTFYYPEQEVGSATVRIETLTCKQQPGDSSHYQRQYLLETLADQIINDRLSKMLQYPDSAMTDAGIGSGYYLQKLRYTVISAESEPDNWSQVLGTIEQVLRQALQYGFTPSELSRAKRIIEAELQRAMDTENTRDSSHLARDLIRSLRTNRVMRSAAQDMALLGPLLKTATLDQVHHAFIDNWSPPHRLVMVTGNAALPKMTTLPAAHIEEVYTRSASVPVSEPQDEEPVGFPYLADPPLGNGNWDQTTLDDLGIEQIDFSNGIHLVTKKTPFKSDDILVTLSFGRGRASQPAELPGLADLTEALLNEAGFGAMGRADLDKALAGRLASIQLNIREDVFQIVGQTKTNDIELLFQLLYAFILDPGYRPETLALVRSRLEQQYTSATHTVEGVMRINGTQLLSGGDSRFGMAPPQNLQMLTLEHIKVWFGTQLKNAPMEIAVVGDLDIEAVRILAERYLGSLPARRPAESAPPARRGPVFPKGQTAILTADSQIDKTLVVVAYPTEDFWDIKRTRRLSFLSSVFSEKLRVRIREKLGAAYSPYAYNRSYRAYPGFGIFQVHLIVDPKLTTAVISEVKQIAAELGRHPISADEFRRSLDPTLTRIKDLRQTNTYWLHSVLSASHRNPQQLDWARTIEADYAAITAEEIQNLAHKYLVNDKAVVVIIQSRHE